MEEWVRKGIGRSPAAAVAAAMAVIEAAVVAELAPDADEVAEVVEAEEMAFVQHLSMRPQKQPTANRQH